MHSQSLQSCLIHECSACFICAPEFSILLLIFSFACAQSLSGLTLCNPMDQSLQAPLSMGILQARILVWVALPSSRGSSWPRDQTQVSRFAGGFFTVWVTREGQEYWNVWPIPFSRDLPEPGIQPGSPVLQEDSLPAKLLGKPRMACVLIFEML